MRLALLALCATLCASAANDNTYEPDAGWPSTPGIDAKYFEELYQKYAKELKEIMPEARAFCARPGVWCLSDQLEMEMSYMRVRGRRHSQTSARSQLHMPPAQPM